MGKAIERIALERGHRIVLKVDLDNREECTDEQLKTADIAIDFQLRPLLSIIINGVSITEYLLYRVLPVGWNVGRR